jgi:hypothetical protein
MFKFKFVLRNVVAIATCLAIVMFSGCDKKEDTVKVTSVSLNKTTLTLAVGGGEKLTATVSPEDATNKLAVWASSDNAVATVDADGNVVAVKSGTATIIVTTVDGEKTASCTVTVTADGGGDTEGHDTNLILPDGQAWVMDGVGGTSSGYIFKADGTYGYYWGTWTLTSQGTWSTGGNSITINQTGVGAQKYTYTVANGTFTMKNAFGDEYVYLKKAVPGGSTGTQVELKSPINAITTLKDLGLAVDYVYKGGWLNITNNAVLTIEPGVTIQFTNTGGGINVADGATIVAAGTAEKRIQFIGGTAKGSWQGFEIYSTADNKFEYCDFINGGSSATYGMIWMSGNTRLSMSNCILDGGRSYGIQAGNGALFPAFRHNAIRNFEKAPVHLGGINSTVEATAFDATNTYTSNTGPNGNAIEVGSTAVAANLTVKDMGMDVDYVFTGGLVHVNANATLKVMPGVDIQFTNTGGGISVAAGGCLQMQGTAAERIRLFGSTTASWLYLEIYGYTDNILEYCDLINGGSSTSYGVIWTSSNSKLSMNHCTIDGSKNYGLDAGNGTEIPSFTGNSITNCAVAPVRLGSLPSVAAFDNTSEFAGNTNNYVQVNGGTVSAPLTVNPLKVPYYMNANPNINAALTVNAGVTFWMGNDVGFTIGGTGRINVNGTAANRVKFTRPAGQSYYWNFIDIYGLGCTFAYTDFEYGSNGSYGAIYLESRVSASFSNSSITNSRYWGVEMASGSSMACTAVTFSNNTSGNVQLPNGQPANITNGTPFTGTLQ